MGSEWRCTYLSLSGANSIIEALLSRDRQLGGENRFASRRAAHLKDAHTDAQYIEFQCAKVAIIGHKTRKKCACLSTRLVEFLALFIAMPISQVKFSDRSGSKIKACVPPLYLSNFLPGGYHLYPNLARRLLRLSLERQKNARRGYAVEWCDRLSVIKQT